MAQFVERWARAEDMNKINVLRGRMKNLSILADDPVNDVSSYYRDVYDRLSLLGEFNNLQKSIEVAGLSELEGIELAAKPSQWEGIRKISLKVSFYELRRTEQYLRILRPMYQLERRYPLNITSISQNGNSLEIMMELYGK